MKQFNKLAMVIAGLWCCMAANAHDFEVDGIYYDIYKTKSVEVTFKGSSHLEYSDEYAGKVEIPESVTYNGKTYSVTSIGQSAFWNCSRLTSITIPNSVTSIGGQAFYGYAGDPIFYTNFCYIHFRDFFLEGSTNRAETAFYFCQLFH